MIVGLIYAVVFGYYTYRGSGIHADSDDGLDGAPGSEGAATELEKRGRIQSTLPSRRLARANARQRSAAPPPPPAKALRQADSVCSEHVSTRSSPTESAR